VLFLASLIQRQEYLPEGRLLESTKGSFFI